MNRYAVLGAVQMTQWALEEIEEKGLERPVAICTLKGEEGRKRHSDYADLSEWGERWGVPVVETIERLPPIDALCVWGWSRLVPDFFLERMPCYGWHPSLLPKGRGRHPLIWQVLNGETLGGFTYFRLTAIPDQGPIMAQVPLTHVPDCTVTELYGWAGQAMRAGLPVFLAGMGLGDRGRLQDETEATVYAKRSPGDEILHPGDPLNERKVRALTHPYLGACLEDGTKIWRVEDLPCEYR